MLVKVNPRVAPPTLDAVIASIEACGVQTHIVRQTHQVMIACTGNVSLLDADAIRHMPGVADVIAIRTSYKLASRQLSPPTPQIRLGDLSQTVVGGKEVVVMAGPCSVEGRPMMQNTARAVQRTGARVLRGGAFKPRTSPYAFQGMGVEALEILSEVRAETGMPVVTEVLDPRQVELVAAHADILQVGARNMQNFALLNELGRVHRPVLLKRGLSASVSELLMSAEYILAQGNTRVILCERGIRTYEQSTRNTLDIAAIPVLKRETYLPVIVDPSHAGGRADLVAPLSLAAVAAGADGLIVEVHPTPRNAMSDADQAIDFAAFDTLMHQLGAVATAVGRTIASSVRPELTIERSAA